MDRSTILKTFFIVPWLIAVLAIGWVVIKRFPPSGTVSISIPFDGSSAWMDPFLPAERTTSPGDQEDGWRGQRIFQDPVYSAARTPGIFDELELQFEFRPIRQPLIEIGMLRDEQALAFDFKPLWFEPLEAEEWRKTTYGVREGFIRDGVSDGLLGSSNYQKLILWHASATPIVMRDETREPEKTIVSLRGSHDFWVLPSGDHLQFEFELQDSNRRKGRDTIIFNVIKDGEFIYQDAVGIGGSQDTTMGKVFSKTVEISGLTPGAYRIQVIAEDDVFIRSIKTPTQRWVVGPRLSFGDLVGYKDDTQVGIAWSNSRHIVLETFHSEGLQTVTYGQDEIKVTRTHDPFPLNRTDTDAIPKKLVAPVGDIRVIGDGWFSFRPEAFFAPQPRRITAGTDLDLEGVEGVLTSYERPEALENGWYNGSVKFKLDPTRDHSRLVLSTPNILSRAGAVDIRHVTLRYKRPPLNVVEWWKIVRQELGNAWRRVKND